MYEMPDICILIKYEELFSGICLMILDIYKCLFEKIVYNFRLEHLRFFLHNPNVLDSKTYKFFRKKALQAPFPACTH